MLSRDELARIESVLSAGLPIAACTVHLMLADIVELRRLLVEGARAWQTERALLPRCRCAGCRWYRGLPKDIREEPEDE